MGSGSHGTIGISHKENARPAVSPSGRPLSVNVAISPLSVWMMLMGVTATMLDGHTDLAYTIAGIAAAIAPLAWGLHLKRTS